MGIEEVPIDNLRQRVGDAKHGAVRLSRLSEAEKNRALVELRQALLDRKDEILAANHQDVEHAIAKGIEPSFVDRLRLDESRVEGIAAAVAEIAALPDPVREVADSWERPNGLQVQRVRIPLGVIAIIYEARPNVTIDAAALCFKSGNGVVLKGGSLAINSNRVLHQIMQDAIVASGLDPVVADAVAFIDSTDRDAVRDVLSLDQYIDLVIPRGGKQLVSFVNEHARMPVLKHDEGVCHVVVEGSAKPDMVDAIVSNSKTQRTSVCNSAESLLFFENAAHHVPRVLAMLNSQGVRLHLDAACAALSNDIDMSWVEATDESFETEFLALELSVAMVSDVDAAAAHIERFGSRHTETIVTEDSDIADSFVRAVNSSCVLVNASTRFADGNQLGLGAEIGISTTRMHAYGPMGLRELTTTKFVVRGNGQIRQ